MLNYTMQINNYKISFKANVTKSIKNITQNVNPSVIEDIFSKTYGIDVKFNGDKALTTCFTLTLNLFEALSEKVSMFKFIAPPRIRVFEPKNLVMPTNANEFCITNTKKVLTTEPAFELRSIFARKMTSLDLISKRNDFLYNKKINSSPHFLANYIHEWSHNLHVHEILNKYGYEGNCPFAKRIYPTNNAKGLACINQCNEKIKDIKLKNEAKNFMGDYSGNSVMEFFAETMTKLITNSLDDWYNLKQNPLDGLNSFPPLLKKFFEQIIYDSFK